MDNWTRLIDAGRELSQAFDLLDRANEITYITTAAIMTKQGLASAAREAVIRANSLLKRH
ncbi:hypothetical protein CU669_15645 [Paramagnetospirillum kuznetsovii]|uniref:Uncharacterized protein n=1 Tax=Paramagnetospirillum kuznetsovii TaxID=2053833 RepID=A0A364NVD1_9PROT|nr:hypothetical protein [Paramagnetospirillum kuznetsovii]RAU21016.1 hypothetical protein CU669_15645 [Paramagnetospirillum kuznetsovii]